MAAYRAQTGEVGISLPDPIAVAVALDPTLCTHAGDHFVDVEVASELTRGMTVVDRLNVAGDDRNRSLWQPLIAKNKKIRVCWTIDIPRWKDTLYHALSREAGW
jgi:purine nucleosidase